MLSIIIKNFPSNWMFVRLTFDEREREGGKTI
jgi:hypothetical protein